MRKVVSVERGGSDTFVHLMLECGHFELCEVVFDPTTRTWKPYPKRTWCTKCR